MIFIAVSRIARLICFYYYLLIGSSVKNVNDKRPVAILRNHGLCFIHSLKQKLKRFELIHVVWQRNIWILFFHVADILWDKLNSKWRKYTNPRPGQYLTHAYSYITRAVGAIDTCFTLTKAHQHGIAVGPMNEQSRVFCCCCCFEAGVHKGVQCCAGHQHTKHRHKTATLYFVNCTLHLASGWVHEHAKYRQGNDPRPPPLTKLHNFTNIYST